MDIKTALFCQFPSGGQYCTFSCPELEVDVLAGTVALAAEDFLASEGMQVR